MTHEDVLLLATYFSVAMALVIAYWCLKYMGKASHFEKLYNLHVEENKRTVVYLSNQADEQKKLFNNALRVVIALVNKAGGAVTLTEQELLDAGTCELVRTEMPDLTCGIKLTTKRVKK